jgi:hypothetical protein
MFAPVRTTIRLTIFATIGPAVCLAIGPAIFLTDMASGIIAAAALADIARSVICAATGMGCRSCEYRKRCCGEQG